MNRAPLFLLFALVFCHCLYSEDAATLRTTEEYAAARKAIWIKPKQEFDAKIASSEIAFYGIGESHEEKCVVPGLIQEEIDRYADDQSTQILLVHDLSYPFYVGDRGYEQKHYWLALEDILSEYNRLVLSHVKSKNSLSQ